MFKEKIQLPKGVEAALNGALKIKGPKGEVERSFKLKGLEIKIEEKTILITSIKETRREAKLLNTIVAHIRNMIRGVTQPFSYILQICSVHFPMTVNVDVQRGLVVIKNFLGEKKERIAQILPGVEVKVEGDLIKVASPNKEAAGQTAANIEATTKIKAKDRRIFQDGIWIIEKAGKKFE